MSEIWQLQMFWILILSDKAQYYMKSIPLHFPASALFFPCVFYFFSHFLVQYLLQNVGPTSKMALQTPDPDYRLVFETKLSLEMVTFYYF